MNVPNAGHFNKFVNPRDSIPIILDFFDITYHANDCTYILYEDNIAILIENRSNECFYGTISSHS